MTTDQYVGVSTEDPGKKVFADIMSEVMNSLIKDACRYRWIKTAAGLELSSMRYSATYTQG